MRAIASWPAYGAKLVALGAILAASAFLASDAGGERPADDGQATARQATAAPARDRFGIAELHPDLAGGLNWVARWGQPRRFAGVDPADPWFDADHGSGSFARRNGELRISGRHPRMHVHDPRLKRQWGDVEITMYFKRVQDTNIRYAGMVAVARTNHGMTGALRRNPCDTRGVSARMRFDGRIDFAKETRHPRSQAAAGRVYWARGLPRNTWIGYKYVVYDRPNGDVVLELWVDRTEGRRGGRWVRINRLIDDGTVFGDKPCARGVDAKMPLSNDPHRAGSESGRPNLSVYFRSDGLARGGLIYKWGSIREITVTGQ